MDCQKIQKLIPLYLDSELEDRQLQTIRKHLKDCPHCQRELTLFEKSWDLLSEWEDIEPVPGYKSRFWSRLSSERAWYEQLLLNIKEFFAMKKRSLALVTASVAIILCVLTFSNYLMKIKTNKTLTAMNPQDLELLAELELAQDFDIIENIDWLEDWEVIEDLDRIES
jgi:predicted anti-sigma-YlaC factor YlaD